MKKILLLMLLISCEATKDAMLRLDGAVGFDSSPMDTTPEDVHHSDGPDGSLPACDTACLIETVDTQRSSCNPEALALLVSRLRLRDGAWAMWDDGRALFVAEEAGSVAASFNGWEPSIQYDRLCNTSLWVARTTVTGGFHAYKIVRDGRFILDAHQRAFVFDDFEGNSDRKNSVLNTHDSGRGHLEMLSEEVCSEALMNCRRVMAYVPPGYTSPDAPTEYPVLYVHDGQNVWDEPGCCFTGGWDLAGTADREITSGRAVPFVIVSADHAGIGRNPEYGFDETDGGFQQAFMRFQVEQLQARAEETWRIDPDSRFVMGSSLGGLISYRLVFAYPSAYKGAASLSGAFWPGQKNMTDMLSRLRAGTRINMSLYLDHGGTFDQGGDGLEDSVAVRDQLVSMGWVQSNAPTCSYSSTALCYFHEPGAQHTESAWRGRAQYPIRFFFGR